MRPARAGIVAAGRRSLLRSLLSGDAAPQPETAAGPTESLARKTTRLGARRVKRLVLRHGIWLVPLAMSLFLPIVLATLFMAAVAGFGSDVGGPASAGELAAGGTGPVGEGIPEVCGAGVSCADLFNQTASLGIDPRLVAAVAWRESGFDPDVVECRRASGAGARGIMQFMPGTAASRGVEPCDPASAIPGGARYLVEQHEAFGSWDLALAAYNAGPGPVDKCGCVPPYAETQAYVEAVNRQWRHYQELWPSGSTSGSADGVGAVDPVDVAAPGGSVIVVDRSIETGLRDLLAAASTDGITLGGSGYRSTDEQIRLRAVNGCPDVWTAPASSCRVPTAIPGTSLHERGLAVDFTCDGHTIVSRDSPCWGWLDAHAATHGFFNLPSEPWHWSTSGA